MKAGNNRITYLDGIRGLATYMVMASHFAVVFIGSAIPDFFQSWVRLGRFGVQIFYILSAFLIAYGFEKTNSMGKTFWLRRIFRIVPLWWLAIASTIVYESVTKSGGGVLSTAPRTFCSTR